MRPKKLLFSVTSKDFEIQTFCTGGNGGQHRNAKQNGVRIIHPASGARAEHRDGRDQGKNKEEAFLKLLKTPEWLMWHNQEVRRKLGEKSLEAKVEEMVQERYLKIEVKDKDGKWTSSLEYQCLQKD